MKNQQMFESNRIEYKQEITDSLEKELIEAVINAIVHNDYTMAVPPKFELFDDRIEITSTGGLSDALSQKEFFEGFSVPRNKEIMRIYKDLELVEQLGSGIPRILESYSEECFKFSDHFLRMTFPIHKQIDEVDEEAVAYGGGPMGGPIGGSIGGPIGSPIGGAMGGAIRNLTDRQNEVLVIIGADQTISYRAIAEKLNVNESAVLKHIEILKTKGYITRIGGTRGYWQIMK